MTGSRVQALGPLARNRGVEQDQCEFTEFCAAARDECLRVVLVAVGDRALAEDLVAEAFAPATGQLPARIRRWTAPC